MRHVASAFLLCLLAAGALGARTRLSAPAGADQGLLFVYAAPLPPAASQLTFRIESIAAAREDGVLVPIDLLVRDADATTLSRERRMAAGGVPPGRYAGLAVRVASAVMEGAAGSTALTPPAEPVIIPARFGLERRQATVLILSLDYRAAVKDAQRFTPAFSASAPTRPAPGLIGVVTSRATDTAALFDKVSGRVAGVVPTGRAPSGLAVDQDRKRAYVADAGEDQIEAVGLLEQTVLSRLPLRAGDAPSELALTPDGRTLVSANSGSSTVSLIDAVPLLETARVPVGNEPRSVLVDRQGRRAYALNTGGSSVTILDLASRAVVTTLSTEPGPFRAQLNRAGDRLYVIHRASPYLSVIDTQALSVANRIYVGTGALAIKVDSQTDRIYLARHGGGEIAIFDPLSLLPVDGIPADEDVSYLTIDGEGNNLYLALPSRGEVEVVRLVGKQVTARAEIGDDPYALALLGER